MITLAEIQKKLAEAIKLSGKTQTALAKELNIKQQTVCQYVSGRAMPALDTFANLCAILDVDPADILCIEDFKQEREEPKEERFSKIQEHASAKPYR